MDCTVPPLYVKRLPKKFIDSFSKYKKIRKIKHKKTKLL